MSFTVKDYKGKWTVTVSGEYWKINNYTTLNRVVENLLHYVDKIPTVMTSTDNTIILDDEIICETRSKANSVIKMIMDYKEEFGRWKG